MTRSQRLGVCAVVALLAACGGGISAAVDAGTQGGAEGSDARGPAAGGSSGGGGNSNGADGGGGATGADGGGGATGADGGGGAASPDGGLRCGDATCDPTMQFCMDQVSAAGETLQCAYLPQAAPCPATCAGLIAAYASGNPLDRQADHVCPPPTGASGSGSSSGSALSVPLTCSTSANGGLTLRGDTFPCNAYNSTFFCLSATEYCFGLGSIGGGDPSYMCQRAPAQCAPATCGCLYDAGTIGNGSSSGASGSSSGYGTGSTWRCADDGGVHAVELNN